MATQNDSGGLTDRRSLRELVETSVAGSRAPLDARVQLANSKRRRELEKREAKRLDKELAKKRKKSLKEEFKAGVKRGATAVADAGAGAAMVAKRKRDDEN